MAPTQPDEPKVRFFSPMPQGYQFLQKGDVYMTANCRKRTQAAGQRVYVVVDKNNKVLGLRCPTKVVRAVEADSAATAATRAAAVQKRDKAIENEFEKALLAKYPLVPRDAVPTILKHTLRKRSGRVGRTGTATLQVKVRLAVVAHIRHRHTDYDQQLRGGVSRDEARKKVWPDILALAASWQGLRPGQKKHSASGNAKVTKKPGKTAAAVPTGPRSPVTAKTVLKPRDAGKVRKRPGRSSSRDVGRGNSIRRSSRTVQVPSRLIDEVSNLHDVKDTDSTEHGSVDDDDDDDDDDFIMSGVMWDSGDSDWHLP